MITSRSELSDEQIRELDQICHDVREHYRATASSVGVLSGGFFSHLSAQGTAPVEQVTASTAPASLAANRDLPTIISDLREHPQFCTSEFVTGPPYSRFYAAVPIKNKAGKRFAVLAIARDVPNDDFSLNEADFLLESALLIAELLG